MSARPVVDLPVELSRLERRLSLAPHIAGGLVAAGLCISLILGLLPRDQPGPDAAMAMAMPFFGCLTLAMCAAVVAAMTTLVSWKELRPSVRRRGLLPVALVFGLLVLIELMAAMF